MVPGTKSGSIPLINMGDGFHCLRNYLNLGWPRCLDSLLQFTDACSDTRHILLHIHTRTLRHFSKLWSLKRHTWCASTALSDRPSEALSCKHF
jgi:hypothetical protein